MSECTEPEAYLWTLLFDKTLEPGGRGGRQTIAFPSFHDPLKDQDELIRYAEYAFGGKVIKIKSATSLHAGATILCEGEKQ